MFCINCIFFFFIASATTEIYTLSLHDALPIYSTARILTARAAGSPRSSCDPPWTLGRTRLPLGRSEEHTSELQSRRDLVCRLLLEKKKKNIKKIYTNTTSQLYLHILPTLHNP